MATLLFDNELRQNVVRLALGSYDQISRPGFVQVP